MTDESQVFLFKGNDPVMLEAFRSAQKTFKYFWREMTWEMRRIVPGLELASVKAPFWDDATESAERSESEHMWINDVDFDGKVVSGELINAPNWVTSVSEGDQVSVPLENISDWMYSISGQVYGAYSVNVLRAQMGRSERAQHDEAWGLTFGDPNKIEIVPADFFSPAKKGGFFKNLFSKSELPSMETIESAEHPMAVNMKPELEKALQQDPTAVQTKTQKGWTMLHEMSAGGSAISVEVLLKYGADINAATDSGMTALDLAKSLGWDHVAKVLSAGGAG